MKRILVAYYRAKAVKIVLLISYFDIFLIKEQKPNLGITERIFPTFDLSLAWSEKVFIKEREKKVFVRRGDEALYWTWNLE